MMKERGKDYKGEFIALLKRCAKANGGTEDLQQVLDTAYEDPTLFLENWLQPLLGEGLNPEEALSVVVEGTLQPN
jgi:hypothetical protein